MSGQGAVDRILLALLDGVGSGVIQLDRRGRIVAANDTARDLLRRGDGLADRGGFLYARAPADNAGLQRLLARALPPCGGRGTGGAMLVRCAPGAPRLVLRVNPLGESERARPARRVGALVLVVDPGRRARIDPALVAAALGLTPSESEVSALLGEGKSVRDIAVATGRQESTIRWHMKHIFNKLGISRQAELVQLVKSLAGVPAPRE